MDTREQDINDFRQAVEEAYGERLTILSNELNRVRRISEKCEMWFERYYSWQPTMDDEADRSLKFDSRIARDLDVFGKKVPAIRIPSSSRNVNVKELFPTRKQALLRLITLSERYIVGADDYVLPHAVVQYTIYKFMVRNWSGPRELAETYDSRLLSPSKQAQFLLKLYSVDKHLASKLLSILSRIVGSLSIYQAVCSGNSTDLINLLSSENSNSVSCAQEITAWEKSLLLPEIADLDKLEGTLQSIHENFFLHPSFPELDSDESDILGTLSYYEWPTSTWGDTEKVGMLEQMMQDIIMQGEGGQIHQLRRPPRFVLVPGEEAFKRLFENMNGFYFVSTYENFAGLFRCPPPKEPIAYSKIEWIGRDGERGIQCFMEALYRKERNERADDMPKKEDISNVFYINGKKDLDIGKNSLYCWGKNKSIDPDHPQEKKIKCFLDLIDVALKQGDKS